MVEKGSKDSKPSILLVILAAVGILILLLLLTIAIIFLVLRPTKPRFSLQDTTVYNLNLSTSTPHLLTSTLQPTISSLNPNHRIGVYYEKLDVYATYMSHRITVPTAISTVYQGHNDAVVWSPFLYGPGFPMEDEVCVAMAQDRTAGMVLLHVRVDGKLRWKVGSWISGKYRIMVNCPAFLMVERGGGELRFLKTSECSVDVGVSR